MNATLARVILLGVALCTCLASWPALAIPAFARRYKTSCTTCHRSSFPRLNAYGRMFKENGYQLLKGAEEPYRARRTVEPGSVIERLSIFKELPLSVRIKANVDVTLPGFCRHKKQVHP